MSGSADGSGKVWLAATAGGTDISFTYAVNVGGKVASVGGRMLQRAAQLVIGQFFERLARTVGGPKDGGGVFSSLRRTFGRKS